ncbi:MAG: glycosyltransferase family 2 protein [Candidatus Uhrbacteria bacterium]|nr:glycosyltransferase family 2 protein [Candidatus Uhrbacteria bacterium]MDP3794222.1 glycosyltransferase family 2 protein [Candidatus Uhrbacteria bacterium]
MKIVAVMPAYQEASRIAKAIQEVLRYASIVIVVDDGSEDETAAVAQKAGATVLRHAINRGQGAALKTGTLAALRMGAEILVHVDADGQHDPSFIPMLIEPIKTGQADVVFGSRFLGIEAEGLPSSRRWLLGIARWFNSFILGVPHRMTDATSGLRAMTAEAARSINFTQDRMAHCSEILRLVTRSSLRFLEVPVKIHYTSASLAKGQKSTDAFKIVWHLFLGFFH